MRPAIAERRDKVNTAPLLGGAQHLSTALLKPLRALANLDICAVMGESRIDKALARIDAAVTRMDAARAGVLAKAAEQTSDKNDTESGSAKVMELVNRHEKLREEVAETLSDLDGLIEELEG